MTSSTPNSPRSEQAASREGSDHHEPEKTVVEETRDPTPDPAQRISELEDVLLRALADIANLKKRQAKEQERAVLGERKRIAYMFLPVIDALDRALAQSGDSESSIVEGIRKVRDEALEIMASLGFPRNDDLGVGFDPSRHEAVLAVSDPGHPPGTVVEVLQPGYGKGDDQLRPAAVAVASESG